jgi:hypothetical protein
MKVISPKELDPASENPKGAGVREYFVTKSSDRRNENTLSDIYYLPFIEKLTSASYFTKQSKVYHEFSNKNKLIRKG